MSKPISTVVRAALPQDIKAVHGLLLELAAFENLANAITTSEEQLLADGFGQHPRFHILVAESGGEICGYLSYMRRYSIWGGGDFINLDDIYIRENARGSGAGLALMTRLAQIASTENLAVRWEVMVDNHSAKRFYEQLGATLQEKIIARWAVKDMPRA